MFTLADVDANVLVLGRHADDHTLVDGSLRIDEQNASVLRVEKSVSCGFTRFVCDERACESARNGSFVGRIACKELVHNALAFGVRQKLVFESEQSARRHFEFHTDTAALRIHRDEFALSYTHTFHNRTDAIGRHVDKELFHRLALYAVDVLEDDLRGAYAELIPFSAHSFDEN